MPDSRDDLLRYYTETRLGLLDAIDGLSDAQMTETSLDGWSVTDHLLHLAFWDDLRASEVTRISAGYDSVLSMSEEQDEAFNVLATDMRRGLSVEQARWELTESRRRLLDAIGVVTERGLDGSLYGEAGLRSGHEAEHTGWIRLWRDENGY